jgi:hypothetical protein
VVGEVGLDLGDQVDVVGAGLVEPERRQEPVARARVTASFSQSRTAMSFVWQVRQMSPADTSCAISTRPASRTRTVPSAGNSKVLSWLP